MIDVDTTPIPPDVAEEEDGEDGPVGSVSMFFHDGAGRSLHAGVTLVDLTTSVDPEVFAENALAVVRAVAALAGPDHVWAVLRRLALCTPDPGT